MALSERKREHYKVKMGIKKRDIIKKARLLYEGKGKKVYQVLNKEDQVVLFFKDDLTARQGRKKGSFPGKGAVCNNISSLIFKHLKKEQIPTHWIKNLSSKEMLCFKTKIIPLEVVIRNRLAGSTADRLGFREGYDIGAPLLEFYYKKDELDDPFISEEQIKRLKLIQPLSFLGLIKKQAFIINKKLINFFLKAGLELIDFKMEFGLYKKQILLADDISPDSCRIWDKKTAYRLDKDRFRRGWGKVREAYKEIEERLYKAWGAYDKNSC